MFNSSEDSIKVLDDQLYVFGKQYHKLFRLKDKVDVIITDSPLLVSIIYNKTPSKYFNQLVVEQYNTFNNLLFYIKRPEIYQNEGRLQAKDEAEAIDNITKNMFQLYNITYKEISCEDAVEHIVQIVLDKLN